jgi:FkbM family methyltransferase
MKIFYGTKFRNIDITEICFSQLMHNNIITIPHGDCNRGNIFTDPLPGVLKTVFIVHENDTTEYSDAFTIKINTLDNVITRIDENKEIDMIDNKINEIHSKLQFRYGNIKEELPEQKMAIKYLTGNEKVLEIGGNIGRNSLVIASILGEKNNNNLVVLESDPNIANQLKENRDINNMNFHIEPSALSKRKLIQRGWETIPSDKVFPGYKSVNTISLDELHSKYNIQFDTFVLDCEGAFYYILLYMPDILENINLVIMENDYHDINHKIYVDFMLTKNNFYRDYVEGGGWGPCQSYFFEVWKRFT